MVVRWAPRPPDVVDARAAKTDWRRRRLVGVASPTASPTGPTFPRWPAACGH